MSISECIKYWEWCARQYWQYQRRGSWKYEWHGDTLIRYVETAPADPDFAAGLLEQNEPISAKELASVFDWRKIRKEDIFFDVSLFDVSLLL